MLRGRWKGFWIGAAVLLLTLGNAALVFADTAISEIKVTLAHQYDEDGAALLEPAVIAGDDSYSVKSVSWSSDSAEWKPGERVTASIHLSPEDGNEFSYYYANDKVTVEDGKCLTFWRESDGGMYIKASYYPVVQLGKTTQAGWSDAAKQKASWSPVPYATAYQLKLYRGENEYVTTLTLQGTSVDLSNYITTGDSYYYEVRATSKDSSDAAFRKNGAYVVSGNSSEDPESADAENTGNSSAEAVSVGSRWRKTADGWRYLDETGVEAAGGWRYIDGSWYYFNTDGYMLTGWCELNGKWYYMGSDGKMHTGWLELNGKYYYMDSTGVMAVGWYQMSPSVWHYFYEDGSMAANTEIDGYVLGADGIMEN